MPKVYILNDGGHDYSHAKEFGELEVISKGILSKFSLGTLYRTLNDKLQHSKPEDYIILSSLSVLCSIATGLMAAKHGAVNFLLFKDGRYIARRVVFSQDQK